MGLTFVRTSQQYAEAAGGPLPGTISTFTIAVWCKPVNATDATSTAFSLGRSGATHYIALGKTSAGVVFLEVAEGGASADAFAGTMSTGTWQHLAGVQSGVTSRVAYLNGSAGSAETSNLTPNTLNVTTLAALVVAGSRVSFLGGDVAHAAVWSIALTAGEIASLAAGARPDSVQSGSLVFYSEVDGVASPEDDLVGTLDLVWGAGGAAPTKSADDPSVGGTTHALSGTSTGTSTSAGSLTATFAVSASSTGTVTTTGALGLTAAVSGSSAGTSISTGALTASYALAGASTGVSTSAGTLTGTWQLAGTSTGTSTTSGSLLAPLGILEGGGGLSGELEGAGSLVGLLE